MLLVMSRMELVECREVGGRGGGTQVKVRLCLFVTFIALITFVTHVIFVTLVTLVIFMTDVIFFIPVTL